MVESSSFGPIDRMGFSTDASNMSLIGTGKFANNTFLFVSSLNNPKLFNSHVCRNEACHTSNDDAISNFNVPCLVCAIRLSFKQQGPWLTRTFTEPGLKSALSMLAVLRPAYL